VGRSIICRGTCETLAEDGHEVALEPEVQQDTAGDGNPDSYLIGVRCPMCGLAQFPSFWICPRCLDRRRPPESFRLSGDATLERFCVAERGPAAFNPPYLLGYLRLAEGPAVYCMVRGVPPDQSSLALGSPMGLVVETVRNEADGTEVVGWVARPAAAGVR